MVATWVWEREIEGVGNGVMVGAVVNGSLLTFIATAAATIVPALHYLRISDLAIECDYKEIKFMKRNAAMC